MLYRYLSTAIGFPSDGNAGQNCTQIEKRQLYTKGGKIHKRNSQSRKQENKTKNRHRKNIINKVEQLENNKEKQIIMTQRTVGNLHAVT